MSVTFEIVTQAFSALAAFAAAVLWLQSAWIAIKAPGQFAITVVRPDGGIVGQPIGAKYVGYGYSQELQEWSGNVTKSFARQSLLSGRAAVCAALSAALQVLATIGLLYH